MGFRDYYRQFDDIDEAALNVERRERRRREKQQALERVPDIDLSGTEWPDLPHSEIVERGDRAGARAHERLSRTATPRRRAACSPSGTGSSPTRSRSGTGPRSCCSRPRSPLLSPGDELVMPWPSYPLYPLLAAHAGATPVARWTTGRWWTR